MAATPTPPNRIKFWRQQRGWTLQKLADAAATTRAQIDKLERGARRLTVDWMVRLAKPLGCDPRSLMPPGADEAATAPAALPVYRNSKGGKPAVSATVPRPYFLDQAPDGYGLIVPDDSLAPMLRAGQIAFFNPRRKPRAGQIVCQAAKKRLTLYLLMSAGKNGLTLRRLQPRVADMMIPQKQLMTLHPLAGMAEKQG